MSNYQINTEHVSIMENINGMHQPFTNSGMRETLRNGDITYGILYSKNMDNTVTVRVNTDNLIGEEKMLNQRRAFGRLAQRYTTTDQDRLFLEMDFNDTIKILRDKGITITDNFKVYLYYIKKLAARASIELTGLPFVVKDPEMEAVNEELLTKRVYPGLDKKAGVKERPTPELPRETPGTKIPTGKAPVTPEGVAPWKPTPKPRTILPKEKPTPKPRTKIPAEKPVPPPRTKHLLKKLALSPTPEPRTIIPKTQQAVILKRPTYKIVQTAINGTTRTYKVQVVSQDPQLQLTTTSYPAVEAILLKNLNEMKGLKYQLTLSVIFDKEGENGEIERFPFTSNHTSATLINKESLEMQVNENFLLLLRKIEEFQVRGSNWKLRSVEGQRVHLSKYSPLEGSSYIPTPKEISNPKMGMLNMQNTNDSFCFRWCHVRFLLPSTLHPTRITKEDTVKSATLNYKGITFPVSIDQITKIEYMNNININVLGYKSKKVFYPIRISKTQHELTLNLLLIDDGEGNNHYILIKDINRLLHSVTKNKEKKHFCLNCFFNFKTEENLQKHREVCLEVNGVQAVKLPPKNTKTKFKNYRNTIEAPFVIYADFESALIPDKERTRNPNPTTSETKRYQTHQAISFGYKRVCALDTSLTGEYKSYVGGDAAAKFIKAIKKEQAECNKIARTRFYRKGEVGEDFIDQHTCYLCETPLTQKSKRPYHCRVTGKYKGAIHKGCESKTFKIPVVFHNLRGYDAHLILREAEKIHRPFTVIPNNMEQYMSFSFGRQLIFIDSIQFMSTSLERLVNNLTDEDFKHTSTRWQGEDLKLVKQKGIFPYEYIDSLERLRDKVLPPPEKFYSTLNERPTTPDDYERAQRVWNHFNMKTLKEYHDLYLETDVHLLADVFETFRKTCMASYHLDPANYISAPSLSWDAFLKQSGAEIELISDMDMFQFFEKGMRGGISQISHRYAKANNPQLPDYNPDEESSFITYLDANNLYGWAMSQPLPISEFKWEDNLDDIILEDYVDGPRGLVLEVDLEYPQDLHDLHNGYPLAPEGVEVEDAQLSEYTKTLKEKFNIKSGHVRKLVTSLNEKKKYVVHVRNLTLYLSLGMKLKKIHRAVSFTQSPWLRDYISFNTKMRAKAKNAFEKDFFKLMNNSIYGKTMENVRKRVNVSLETTEKGYLKAVASPTFQSRRIITKGLVIVKKRKEVITLNKPCYVGMCILDLSKTLMYDFHYNTIKKKYGSRAKLMFTDTDSLIYHIKTNNVYEDFKEIGDCWDNSDYPKDSPYYNTHNKKVIGKFKDETAGTQITEFVGLRSKMYSYTKNGGGGGKTAKGVKRYVIKDVITHKDYKDVLTKQKQMRHTMNSIRSVNHQLGTYEQQKISLSCYDDKRYLKMDGIASYAYGHRDIKY